MIALIVVIYVLGYLVTVKVAMGESLKDHKGSTTYSGRIRSVDDWDPMEDIFPVMLLSLLWPLLIPIGILVGVAFVLMPREYLKVYFQRRKWLTKSKGKDFVDGGVVSSSDGTELSPDWVRSL